MATAEKDINVIAGKNIRAVREKMGLSQDVFAELCDVHRTYIGAVERGERNITLNTLARIASAAKTTPIELLKTSSSKKLVL
jgi:transcriptional regulator with XRE-family HTH domain